MDSSRAGRHGLLAQVTSWNAAALPVTFTGDVHQH